MTIIEKINEVLSNYRITLSTDNEILNGVLNPDGKFDIKGIETIAWYGDGYIAAAIQRKALEVYGENVDSEELNSFKMKFASNEHMANVMRDLGLYPLLNFMKFHDRGTIFEAIVYLVQINHGDNVLDEFLNDIEFYTERETYIDFAINYTSINHKEVFLKIKESSKDEVEVLYESHKYFSKIFMEYIEETVHVPVDTVMDGLKILRQNNLVKKKPENYHYKLKPIIDIIQKINDAELNKKEKRVIVSFKQGLVDKYVKENMLDVLNVFNEK